MEPWFVLIPDELSLSMDLSKSKPNNKYVVVANTRIPKGTRFKPLQGTIRYGEVNVFYFIPCIKISLTSC